MRRALTILAYAVTVIAVWVVVHTATQASERWRKVMEFEVLDRTRDHKADLGNHRIVVASWKSDLGWEIGVFNYPLKGNSKNMLYQGRNLHGIQPWMVFPWTTHRQTYPDKREMSYDNGNAHPRIVLVNCETRQVGSNAYEFVKGRIDIFHKP